MIQRDPIFGLSRLYDKEISGVKEEAERYTVQFPRVETKNLVLGFFVTMDSYIEVYQ